MKRSLYPPQLVSEEQNRKKHKFVYRKPDQQTQRRENKRPGSLCPMVNSADVVSWQHEGVTKENGIPQHPEKGPV